MEENIVVESGDQLTSYTNPLAQQPPVDDTSFHGPMEGHLNSPIRPNYGPDALFLGNLDGIGNLSIWSM